MNPNDRHIIDRHDLKSNHRPSALSVLRLFAFLFVALSPAIAAARPAVVLGSFTEQSNASAMLETLAERDELAGIALTVAINETRDNTKGQSPLFRVVAYTPDPSQTRALLRQLRAAGASLVPEPRCSRSQRFGAQIITRHCRSNSGLTTTPPRSRDRVFRPQDSSAGEESRRCRPCFNRDSKPSRSGNTDSGRSRRFNQR